MRPSLVCLLPLAAIAICSAQVSDFPGGREGFHKRQQCETAQVRAGHEEAGEDGDTDKDDPRSREKWFVQQRAWPQKHIPAGAYWRAQQQRNAMMARERARVSKVATVLGPQTAAALTDPLSSATWTPLGPEPLGGCYGTCEPWAGRTTSIAIDPTDDLTVYIGTAGGGVWKTIDGGQTWKPLTDTRHPTAVRNGRTWAT